MLIICRLEKHNSKGKTPKQARLNRKALKWVNKQVWLAYVDHSKRLLRVQDSTTLSPEEKKSQIGAILLEEANSRIVQNDSITTPSLLQPRVG